MPRASAARAPDASRWIPSFAIGNPAMAAGSSSCSSRSWCFRMDAQVEPISGKMDLGCKTWTGEQDPMQPLPKKEGMIEGKIILGPSAGGL
ncbi:hypothetical protein [Paenibacillus periandrae]|uniref:hypothetical protein n=1 Tax=Paenibacillus periandrae TaxID=1761741 RepID=UPI001F089F2B|nr:hypothetical protein [Paenibacillus periandrae]